MRRYGIRVVFICSAFIIFPFAATPAQMVFPLPETSSKRLLNDLQITVAADRNMGETMTIGLVLRYGAAFDPAGKGGLANLVSRMFMKATADHTAKSIQDELDYLGASIEVTCDWDGFRFILRGQGAKYERSLLLLYQIVGEAQFSEADLAAAKRAIMDGLQKPEDPRQRILAQLERDLFAGTTYGRPLEGTSESLSAITLGDVRLFYRRYFSPNQAFLFVAGDVPADQVFQKASRIWGVWIRNDEIPFTFKLPRNPAGRRILLEDDPGSPAAQFVVGCLFPRREDPEYLPALIAAHLLQERLTKVLPTSLLTVGNQGRRMASPFYVQGQAAAEQTVDQIRKIQDAVEELKQAVVPIEELSPVREHLIEEFKLDLGTTDGLCEIMLDAELYHLGSNYAASFPELIRRCDADAIRRAAQNWLFPGGEVILIRGPAAVLKPTIESLGVFQPLTP
jgi:zinc protease